MLSSAVQPGPQPSPTAMFSGATPAAQSQLIPPDHHRSVVKTLIVMDMVHNTFFVLMFLLQMLNYVFYWNAIGVDTASVVSFIFLLILLIIHAFALCAGSNVWQTTDPSTAYRAVGKGGCCGWTCITITLIVFGILLIITFAVAVGIYTDYLIMFYISPLMWSIALRIVSLVYVMGYNKELNTFPLQIVGGGQTVVISQGPSQKNLFPNSYQPQPQPSTIQPPPQQATKV